MELYYPSESTEKVSTLAKNASDYDDVISALQSGTKYSDLNSAQKELADTLKNESGSRGDEARRAMGDPKAGSWGIFG